MPQTPPGPDDARLPLRFSRELHGTIKVLAEAKGQSMNSFVIDAVDKEVERSKKDDELMSRVEAIVEQERELYQSIVRRPESTPKKKATRKKTTKKARRRTSTR